MSGLLFLFTLILVVAGDIFTPTEPAPGDVFKAGGECTISWKPGNWTNVTITLMSGSNTKMKPVTPVEYSLDGSDPSLTPYQWTCPEVDPYSAIYFYQFTNGNDTTWTTRFTITSPSGSFDPPEYSSQPNGDAIPWGIGSLRNDQMSGTTNTGSKPTQATGQVNQSTSTMTETQRFTTMKQRQATPTLDFPILNTTTKATTTATFPRFRADNANSGVLGLPVPAQATLFILAWLCVHGAS